MPTFQLVIATQERVVLSRQIGSLVAPGVEGYLGILARHAPLISALDVGKLKIINQDGTETFAAISGGLLEVSHNVATILADSIELAAEINVDRAERALERAQKRLSQLGKDIDKARARLALRKALNRLKVATS